VFKYLAKEVEEDEKKLGGGHLCMILFINSIERNEWKARIHVADPT